MQRYLFRRALQVIPLFFIVTVMVFGLMHLAPGGPEQIFLSGEDPNIKPEDILELRKQWGLDDPFPVQYGKWLKRVFLEGDLGRSYASQRPVTEAWMERLPASVQLNVVVISLIYLIAIPMGIICAVRQYSILDYFVSTLSFLGLGMPDFWVGLMLIFLVALKSNGLIPTSGMSNPEITMQTHGMIEVFLDRLRYMLLPVLTIVFGGTAGLTRYMRSQMLEVLREDYIRTARAKGLAEKVVIYKHAMRNAMLPIITQSSGLIANLFGGSVVIETVFAWPGVGQLSVAAVGKKDFPVVMAFLLFGFFVGQISSFVTEAIYVFIDPRIKFS